MAESEAELVVRKWREMFATKGEWSMRLKLRTLAFEADFHRQRGREEVAKAVEALVREIAN